jgi:hypothetical protein
LGSRVNLALKNCGSVGAGVIEGNTGTTVGIRVEVGGNISGVGVEISGVGETGVSTSISNVQPELQKTITMRKASIFFITSPS